jgi:hypothetical protein
MRVQFNEKADAHRLTHLKEKWTRINTEYTDKDKAHVVSVGRVLQLPEILRGYADRVTRCLASAIIVADTKAAAQLQIVPIS